MGELEVLNIFEDDIPPEDGWRLVSWCIANGADEFTIDGITSRGTTSLLFDGFDRVADAHRRPSAQRRRLSAYTPDKLIRHTKLWHFNDTTLGALREVLPNGIFTYDVGSESWFEDLTIYRTGELMLGIVTHENEGVLRITPRERVELDALGIKYRLEGAWVSY